jgi:hypothetical protein
VEAIESIPDAVLDTIENIQDGVEEFIDWLVD